MDTDNSMPDSFSDSGTSDPGFASSAASRGRAITQAAPAQALSTRQIEDMRLIHREDAMREQADAFRELRTRLLALGGDTNFVTMIAPVRYGCGGSFVARNLATAFAFDESKHALLIDCDARHPTQGRAFRTDSDHGLIDYLENPARDLSETLHASGLPRLQLIPLGRTRETSDEAFSSFRMRTMVDSLRAQQPNRYIFLDAPPVEGSPDARILSDLADLVILVAGYGQVTPEAIDKAVAAFPSAKLAGVVFNQRP